MRIYDHFPNIAYGEHIPEYVTLEFISRYTNLPSEDLVDGGLLKNIPYRVTRMAEREYKWVFVARRLSNFRLKPVSRNHPYDKISMPELMNILACSDKGNLSRFIRRYKIPTFMEGKKMYAYRKDVLAFIRHYDLRFMATYLRGDLYMADIRTVFGLSKRTLHDYLRLHSRNTITFEMTSPGYRRRRRVSAEVVRECIRNRPTTYYRHVPIMGEFKLPKYMVAPYLGFVWEDLTMPERRELKTGGSGAMVRVDEVDELFDKMWCAEAYGDGRKMYTRENIKLKFKKNDLWIDMFIVGHVDYILYTGERISAETVRQDKAARLKEGRRCPERYNTIRGWARDGVEAIVDSGVEVPPEVHLAVLKHGFNAVRAANYDVERLGDGMEIYAGSLYSSTVIGRTYNPLVDYNFNDAFVMVATMPSPHVLMTERELSKHFAYVVRPANRKRHADAVLRKKREKMAKEKAKREAKRQKLKEQRQKAKEMAREIRKAELRKYRATKTVIYGGTLTPAHTYRYPVVEDPFEVGIRMMFLEKELKREARIAEAREILQAETDEKNRVRQMLNINQKVESSTPRMMKYSSEREVVTILFASTRSGAMYPKYRHTDLETIMYAVNRVIVRRINTDPHCMSENILTKLRYIRREAAAVPSWIVIANATSYVPDVTFFEKLNEVPPEYGAVGAYGYGYRLSDGSWSSCPDTYGYYNTYSLNSNATGLVAGTKGLNGMHEVAIIDGPFIAVRGEYLVTLSLLNRFIPTFEDKPYIISAISLILNRQCVRQAQINVSSVKCTAFDPDPDVSRSMEIQMSSANLMVMTTNRECRAYGEGTYNVRKNMDLYKQNDTNDAGNKPLR